MNRVQMQNRSQGQPVASLPQPPVIPAQVPAVIQQSTGPQMPQQQVVQPAGPNPQAVAMHMQPQVQPNLTPAPTVQQPQNPFLQASLYQAMKDQGSEGGLTMDDLGNVMLTKGRATVHYRSTNASEDMQRLFSRH